MKRRIEELEIETNESPYDFFKDLFSEKENTTVSTVIEKKLDESAIAEEIFSSLESAPSFKGDNQKARNSKLRGKYVIHTMNTLPELLEEIRKSSSQENIIIRFVLTHKHELLFAREGLPNSTLPPHFAMTGLSLDSASCRTAGNAAFDKEGNLVFLSHKSGDFLPSWDSLQYGLFAFLACGTKFRDVITLQKQIITNLTISLDSLKKELDARFTPEQKEHCKNVNKNLVINKPLVYPITRSYLTSGETFFAEETNCSGEGDEPSVKPSINFEF
jgi:hypothetical protein